MPNPDMHNKSAMVPDSAGTPRSSVLIGRLAGGRSHMVPVGHVKIRNKEGMAMTAEKLVQISLMAWARLGPVRHKTERKICQERADN